MDLRPCTSLMAQALVHSQASGGPPASYGPGVVLPCRAPVAEAEMERPQEPDASMD